MTFDDAELSLVMLAFFPQRNEQGQPVGPQIGWNADQSEVVASIRAKFRTELKRRQDEKAVAGP